jgi:hypothetical protein
VRVLERHPAEQETFGFGVAFHEATLRKLAEADPVSRAGLEELLRPWDDVAFHVRGTGGDADASRVVPTSDFIRHSLKVATGCAGPRTREAAVTILVSGRADLVETR